MQLAQDLHMSINRLLHEMDSQDISKQIAFYIYKDNKKEINKQEKNQVNLKNKFMSIMGGKLKSKGKNK